jgi:hypothetical protein
MYFRGAIQPIFLACGLAGWVSSAGAGPAARESKPGFELEIGGYGEMHFTYYDHGADQTKPGGSQSESRATFDTARFVAELEGKLPGDFEFEAEVEFEHGGTGTALELEYEEFGEYETEVEQGGEVVLENLYLEKGFGEHVSVKVGRFYLAFGLLSAYHRPTDYVASARPESETTVIPAVWDEMGASVALSSQQFELTIQIVNGLDSTGFSSQRWIASGHQRRFELTRASALAFVARAALVGIDGLVLGASAYRGDTNGNRPKPDLEGRPAPVTLVDVHFVVERGPVRARTAVIWGRLENAAEISEKNRSLSNNLGVYRSPVADEAIAVWSEAGVNVLGALEDPSRHRLEPFARFEYYDTMFRAGAGRFDNPRFARALYGGGLGYTYHQSVVLKLDWTHRRLGSSEFRPENSARFAAGFVF